MIEKFDDFSQSQKIIPDINVEMAINFPNPHLQITQIFDPI
jgi:hypothetical protein